MPRDDTTAEVVGRILCEARDAAGLTQEALAAKAKMDRSYVSDVERGKASLSVDRLLRLSKAFGITAAKLIQRIESNVPFTRRQ